MRVSELVVGICGYHEILAGMSRSLRSKDTKLEAFVSHDKHITIDFVITVTNIYVYEYSYI